MKAGVSGFKTAGDWDAIVVHGERITTALKQATRQSEALTDWDEWRPKSKDDYQDTIEKTADYASVSIDNGEQAEYTLHEDVREAENELVECIRELIEDDIATAIGDGENAAETMEHAFVTEAREVIHPIEKGVYEHVMTQISPCYFDNELVSANLNQTGPNHYVFEININDDDIKGRVSEILDKYIENGS